jgi:hypothetical protein
LRCRSALGNAYREIPLAWSGSADLSIFRLYSESGRSRYGYQRSYCGQWW